MPLRDKYCQTDHHHHGCCEPGILLSSPVTLPSVRVTLPYVSFLPKKSLLRKQAIIFLSIKLVMKLKACTNKRFPLLDPLKKVLQVSP